METVSIIEVTPFNVMRETLFCVKDTKSPGFACKKDWFIQHRKLNRHLRVLAYSVSCMMENCWKTIISVRPVSEPFYGKNFPGNNNKARESSRQARGSLQL